MEMDMEMEIQKEIQKIPGFSENNAIHNRSFKDLSFPIIGRLNLETLIKKILKDKRWVSYISSEVFSEMCNSACLHPDVRIEFLQWLKDYGYGYGWKFSENSMNNAAAIGRIDLLEWFHSNDCKFTMRGAKFAAFRGHFETLKWLYEHIDCCGKMDKLSFFSSSDIMDYAAGGGHIEILEWLYEHQAKFSYNAMNWAAEFGNIEIIEWLQKRVKICGIVKDEKIPFLTDYAVSKAAENGNIEVLNWLYEHKVYDETFNMADAARNGHIEILEKHLSRGGYCGSNAMDYAALNGHIKTLEWLRDNIEEITFTSRTMELALLNGHIETFEWLFNHRESLGERKNDELPKITSKDIERAIYFGNIEAIKWLKEHQEYCETQPIFTSNLLKLSINQGWYEQTKYLYEKENLRLDDDEMISALDGANCLGYFRMNVLINRLEMEDMEKMEIY